MRGLDISGQAVSPIHGQDASPSHEARQPRQWQEGAGMVCLGLLVIQVFSLTSIINQVGECSEGDWPILGKSKRGGRHTEPWHTHQHKGHKASCHQEQQALAR